MSGHVFHPGHDEWHGQTVVVCTSGRQTVVGRWHEIVGGRLTMHDVAVHEEGGAAPSAAAGVAPAPGGHGGAPESREAWVARLKQYGIPVSHRSFALPADSVTSVVRLRDA